MAGRLPVPGQDNGVWGDILNDYLSVEHNTDGTLKRGVDIDQAQADAAQALVTAQQAASATIADNSVTKTKLATAVQTSLDKADTALQTAPVTSVAGKTGAVTIAYGDITGTPSLATVAASGAYADISGKPTLATVATSGSYVDLVNKPTIPAAQVNTDWNATSGPAQILNKPAIVKPGDLVINVKDYGAVGDGIADDTAAIAAAVAAGKPATHTAKSAVIFFPAGTYITGPITMHQRMTFMGTGMSTTIKLKANSPILANLFMNEQDYSGVNDAQSIYICNMRLNGNKWNQLPNSWNCGIVLKNNTPSGQYEYTDGRSRAENLLIEEFTGDGFVQDGRGDVMASNISVWSCDGFGFNLGIDSYYSNCDAGGSGIDGFLLRGNNELTNCKAWFSGSKLMTTRYAGSPSTALSVTPPANSWDGGNIAGLTFSLANGFGNGFLWYNIGGSSAAGNFNGGAYSALSSQDNARSGFYIRGGRHTLVGIEADSNNNNGTSDGSPTGVPVGNYAGVELDDYTSDCMVTGLSWERSANLNHQAAALYLHPNAGRNRIELNFVGPLNDGSNMPPLATGTVVGKNHVKMRNMDGGVNTPSYAATYAPDPFMYATHQMTLTGNVTLENPAMAGTNTTGIFLVQGMRLTITFIQDAVGGRSVTLGSGYRLGNYQFVDQANAVSTINFLYDGTYWRATSGTHTLPSAHSPVTIVKTGASQINQYQKIATATIATQYYDTVAKLHVLGYSAGPGVSSEAGLTWRVKQQSALGSAPDVQLSVSDPVRFSAANFVAVVESTTVTSTVVSLWVQAPQNSESYAIYETSVTPSVNSSNNSIVYAPSSNIWSASLPVGTQTTATVANVTLGTNTFTGTQTAPAYIAAGLTGATAASRYAGATNSGAPTTGTFAVGDYTIDRSGDIWICTTAGTPGTWTSVGSNASAASLSATTTQAFSGNVSAPAFEGSGLTGATATSRYVGATNSGAPTTGTFAVGDFVIDQSGNIWVCTAAGTPGTWVAIGISPLMYPSITVARPQRPESGSYLVNTTGTGTNVGPWTLGNVYLQPLDVAVPTTYTGLGTSITAVAAGGTSPLVHIGLYADDGTGARPTGAVLANTEVTLDPTSSTGDRFVTWSTPITLAPGRYWAGWMLTSGTALTTNPTMVSVTVAAPIGVTALGNNSHRSWVFSSSGGANSATMSSVATLFRLGSTFPIVGMRVQ